MKLYGYWRSSASWRVRWALELKGLAYEYVPVNLLKNEHRDPPHLIRHPGGQVPVLEVGGRYLTESLAIIDWLEHAHPQPPLFPADPWTRAKDLELVECINSGTAPLQTPTVQKRHSAEAGEQAAWAREFIEKGLRTFAALRPDPKSPFSLGDELSLADLYLVPQVYNALRYQVQLTGALADLARIYETCLNTRACSKAAPEQQIDAP